MLLRHESTSGDGAVDLVHQKALPPDLQQSEYRRITDVAFLIFAK